LTTTTHEQRTTNYDEVVLSFRPDGVDTGL
jgi:hypothetical protein